MDSTMEHTWALILGLARNVARDDAAVKAGGWEQSYATGLKGKTLAPLGFGRLGAATARVGILAFGMTVITWSRSLTQDEADEKAEALGLQRGSVKVVQSKVELCRKANILGIHYVLSERRKGIIGPKELELLQSTAFLVNTSRGPLVDEKHCCRLSALKSGRITGAASDVFDTEPLPLDSEWRTTKWGRDGRSQVLLSPHMGYVEEDAMNVWYDEIVENVERWLERRPLLCRLN
jgi:lactate dehydrogenase-like 2-hydroxyacid dehydrogenase